MKLRHQNSLNSAACNPSLLGLCTICLCFLNAGRASAQTWDGGGANANWSTVENWTGDSLPVSPTALTFGGVAQPSPVNDLPALTQFNGITFSNNGTTGQDAGFNLSGNSITLGGNITTNTPATGTSPAPNGVAMNTTVALDLVLSANSAFVPNRNGTTLVSHTLVVSGQISGPFNLSKTGPANLTLSNPNNSFSGSLTLNANNDVIVGTIQPSGTNSSIGSGSVINLANGNLIVNGNVAASGNINRTINLTATGTSGVRIDNNNSTAANSLVFDGPMNFSGTSGTTTFALGGSNTGTNEFKSILANGTGSNTAAFTKTGGGAWILSGNNTYTGLTSIENGTLQVSAIADSGISNIGFGTNMRVGLGNSTGNFNFTGNSASTARQVRIGFFNGSNGSGGATINANGSSGGTGLKFTNPTFNDQSTTSPSVSTNRTLTLGGSNTDANEIAGVIQNGSASNLPTLLTKSGTGRWQLGGANTYAGTTSVNGGVLQLNSAEAIPSGITTAATTNTLTLNGGILGLGHGNFTRSLGTGAGQVNITGGGSGFAAYNADRVVNLGGASAPVQWVGGTGFFVSGGNTMALSHATATHTVDFQNPMDLNNFGRSINVGNGAADIDAILSGVISSSAGTPALSKEGSGTLMLSAENTWTGSLNLVAGTVKFGGSSGNVITNGGTVQLGVNVSTTGTVLDLNGRSETIGALSLGGGTGGNPAAAGLTHSIVNTGAAAVLTLNGQFNYFSGTTNQNGQATISASINPGVSNRNLVVADSTIAPVDLLVSGVITGAGSGFNKAGAGVLVISGANDYTGPTAISAGVLRLGGNNTLPDASAISLNAGTLDVSTFTDTAGTLDANALGATISLGTGGAIAFAASNSIDWTGGSLNITGAFVSGASVRFGLNAFSLTATQLSLITVNGTAGITLDSNGYLIGSADPYLTWSGGAPFDGDANNDGVQNGLAWLLGAAGPGVSAVNKLPLVAELPGGGLQMTFNMLPSSARGGASLTLQQSSDLGISDPWASVLVPDTTGGSAPVTFVVTGTDPLTVVGTVASSQAAGGKLFGRLRANR